MVEPSVPGGIHTANRTYHYVKRGANPEMIKNGCRMLIIVRIPVIKRNRDRSRRKLRSLTKKIPYVLYRYDVVIAGDHLHLLSEEGGGMSQSTHDGIPIELRFRVNRVISQNGNAWVGKPTR